MLVDRLEELLALLEDENEEEEREDALGLRAQAAVPDAPAPEIRTEKAAEDGENGETLAQARDEGAAVQAGALSWGTDVRMASLEGQAEALGADGTVGVGERGDAAGCGAAELLRDGLAAPVVKAGGTAALKRPGAGDVEAAGLTGAERPAGAAEMGAVMDAMTAAEKGLEELYKQTVQASRPAAQNLLVEQAGRTARAEEPGRTAALTVDELDRAVRRDSRRYDGGMTLF